MATLHPPGTILRHPNRLTYGHHHDWIVTPTGDHRCWDGGVPVPPGRAEYTVLGRLPPHLVDTATEWKEEYKLPNCHLEDPENNPVEWRPEGFWAIGLTEILPKTESPPPRWRPPGSGAYRLPTNYDPEKHDLWWVEPPSSAAQHGGTGWRAREAGFWSDSVPGYTLVDPARPAARPAGSRPAPLPPGTRFRFRSWPTRVKKPANTTMIFTVREGTEGDGQRFSITDPGGPWRSGFGVLPTDDIEILPPDAPDWRTPGTVFRFRTVPDRDWSPVQDLVDTTRVYVITRSDTNDGNVKFRRLASRGPSGAHGDVGVAATDDVEILAHLSPECVDEPFATLDDLDPSWLTPEGRALVSTPKSQLRPGTVFRLKTPHYSFAPEKIVGRGEWDQPLVVIGNDRFPTAPKGKYFRRLCQNALYWGSISSLPDDLEIIGQLPEDDMDATEMKDDHTESTVEVRDVMLPVGTKFRFRSFPERWKSGYLTSSSQEFIVIEQDFLGEKFFGGGQPIRRSNSNNRWSSTDGVLPTDDIEILDEVQDMNADRVKELEKEIERLKKELEYRERMCSIHMESADEMMEAWRKLTGFTYYSGSSMEQNIDHARASMEASNTNRPEGRKMSFMKKLLIVFTVGTLAGGNVGNLKDAGVAVMDHFHGPNEIIAGEFVAAPTCKDCSEIFATDSQVVICGKCGSENIGRTVYAPLYRDRGFPLTDQQVGIQIRNDDGSKSVVLETGEKIEVEK